jgi:hypothetical protein
MRRVVVVLAVCALGSFVLAGSAQAAGGAAGLGGSVGARPAVKKAAKPKQYEWCGTASGCGFVFGLYKKTKTWVEEVGGGFSGTYYTGPKGLLVLEWPPAYGCVATFHKVKKSKNYDGSETGPLPCYTQEVTLTYL